MENIKRAIILDMDETLEHGMLKSNIVYDQNGSMMTLRPKLDILIKKLKEAKSQGIDIILCTTAHNTWVERFLTLAPEFKEIFDKFYTRDNKNDWNTTGCYQKPVETFGYNSVLFIDDSRAERNRLTDIYDDNQIIFPVDITYFSGFGFGDQIDLNGLIRYIELAQQDGSIYPKLQELLNIVRDESGCNMMCSVIDTFVSKEFKHGLTIEDENYKQEYKIFTDSRDDMIYELDDILWEKKDKIAITEQQRNQVIEYMGTDKKIPFENIEQLLLCRLVQTSNDIQARLDEAKKLEKDYKDVTPKKDIDGQEL